MMDSLSLWRRYEELLCVVPSVGLTLDISRMDVDAAFFDGMEPFIQRAYDAMDKLEAGEIANPDENRMVGHYWLRAPHLAPETSIRTAIEATVQEIIQFASQVHDKTITPPASSQAAAFTDVLIVGIGGSALGPQLVSDALGQLGGKKDKLNIHFVDNTDPDGIDRAILNLGTKLKSTLVVVISKSGGTKETRNGMIEIEKAFAAKGLDFTKHAVAVTGKGSELDKHAIGKAWLKRFPMWDWVGGRTSLMSAVGLLPMALQGLDIRAFLEGASDMDKVTRLHDTASNPAARLALMWYHATGGQGRKDMVILPYKDRLLLLSRYLQQLIMESLGKEYDLDGQKVEQGISVYGNKGSTDQHAFVQQLRDGVNNFFVNFLVVLQDRSNKKPVLEVEPGISSGDYLNGFWQGTRQALYEKGRMSLTITLDTLDAHSLGAIIALYERAVGLYATLINVNAYHQPGVEAGKKAATAVLELQQQVVAFISKQSDSLSAAQIADAMGLSDKAETIYHILEHLAANKRFVSRRGRKFKKLTK